MRRGGGPLSRASRDASRTREGTDRGLGYPRQHDVPRRPTRDFVVSRPARRRKTPRSPAPLTRAPPGPRRSTAARSRARPAFAALGRSRSPRASRRPPGARADSVSSSDLPGAKTRRVGPPARRRRRRRGGGGDARGRDREARRAVLPGRRPRDLGRRLRPTARAFGGAGGGAPGARRRDSPTGRVGARNADAGGASALESSSAADAKAHARVFSAPARAAHVVPMRSLSNVFTDEEARAWERKSKARAGARGATKRRKRRRRREATRRSLSTKPPSRSSPSRRLTARLFP